jgi:hypothetical protein
VYLESLNIILETARHIKDCPIKSQIQLALRVAFGTLGLLMCISSAAAAPTRFFPYPDRIRYDSHCLTIDGKDTFIYGGAFHYFRCPKELWPARFQKIKDAGFNTVETYVPWNWSERQMPVDLSDLSKVNLADLDDFLTMAEQFGFYVIVRPGPYICAEWDTGGFPQWLLAKKPAQPLRKEGWLRSDDPVYLAWWRHWYDAVCPIIAKHQITRKPPGEHGIILLQVENEYDYASFPDEVKSKQVTALAEDARANGVEIPLITCWTSQVRATAHTVTPQIFDCCNFYPRWDVDGIKKDIDRLRREQPDAPLGTTELQGGWFSQVGGKLEQELDGINASQINNLTLFAIQNGETLLNYYMLCGGSNPGDWAARDVTASYDYVAPIREWGGVGDRYQRVKSIGELLQQFGSTLVRSEAVDCDVSVPQHDVTVVMRRAIDGGRFLFVRTSQHREPRAGTAHVVPKVGAEDQAITFDYQLEPFGSKVLYLAPGVNDAAHAEWLPKPAPAIKRPTDVPASVTITSAKSRNDPGPAHWTQLKSGEDLARAGIYDSRFIFYRANITSPIQTNLLIEYPVGDAVCAMINGKVVPAVGGTPGASVFAFSAGSSDVRLIYENAGHASGGHDMESPCGLLTAQLTSASAMNEQPIADWRMHEVDGANRGPEINSNFNDDDWPHVVVTNSEPDNLPSMHTAVYRAEMDLSQSDFISMRLILRFGCIDDFGWVFVNGKPIGETFDWSRAYSFDVTQELHPGRNSVSVIVQNKDGSGGLGAPIFCRKFDGHSVTFAAFGNPAGIEQQWWIPGLDDRRWQTVSIGEHSGNVKAGSMLTWFRMKFALPVVSADVWFPWRLHLEATGNGFVYLNGHPLGRYWQVGPQHDFFLPENWLNFGTGASNNLTVSLRPLDLGAAIQSTMVGPYVMFAEKR